MLPRALFLSLFLATTAGAADLAVRFYPTVPTPVHGGDRHGVEVIVENLTPNAMANATLSITFDPSFPIEFFHTNPQSWSCETQPGRVDCSIGGVIKGGMVSVVFVVRAPSAPEGGDYDFTARVSTSTNDPNPSNDTAVQTLHVIRQIIVSNTNDSGPGSLRAAIDDANGWCTPERPCAIRFRLPEGAANVIEPQTPLPALTACGVVVGDPPLFGGAAVPVQAEINGASLELRSACTYPHSEFYGIGVSDAPGDGIVITAPASYWLSSVEVRRNGGRGIAVNAAADLRLRHGVVEANGRSGIQLNEGLSTIEKSRIEDNRASGIYVAPAAFGVYLDDTVIANHPHFGLALAGRTGVKLTDSVVINDNGADLDWFLDGPSAPRRADIPQTPRILSAMYDAAANVTRVTFTLDSPTPTAETNIQVRLYTSDRVTHYGTAHLESLVGTKWIDWKAPIAETYTIDVKGDLRGRHVSAVTTFWSTQPWPDMPLPEMRSASEVSAALSVE